MVSLFRSAKAMHKTKLAVGVYIEHREMFTLDEMLKLRHL